MSYGFGKGGRARYAGKLIDRIDELKMMSSLTKTQAFTQGFSRGEKFADTFLGKTFSLTGSFWDKAKGSNGILSKVGNGLASATVATIGNFCAGTLTGLNAFARVATGVSAFTGRLILPLRKVMNKGVLKIVRKFTNNATEAEIQSALKAYHNYQQANAGLIAANREVFKQTQNIRSLAKTHGIPAGDDMIVVLGQLQKAGHIETKFARRLLSDFQSARSAMTKSQDLVKTSALFKGTTAETKLFASLAKIDSASDLERSLERLENSSRLGLTVINTAEKALIGSVVASGLAPIIVGTDWSTVPSYLWSGTKATTSATADAAYYLTFGGRGGQHESWYRQADLIGLKTADKRRFVLKFSEMSIVQLASLYFNKGQLSASEIEALHLVIMQKGITVDELVRAFYKDESGL
jgi:hypothetical protein